MENRVKEWMVEYVSEIFQITPSTIKIEETFDQLSLDSIEAVIMAGLMEEAFDIEIDPIELYENPSIARFAKHLAARTAGQEPATTVT